MSQGIKIGILKNVALSPEGCVLLHDRAVQMQAGSNGWKKGSAFWQLWEGLEQSQKEGTRLKCVAFAPDGGYVVLKDVKDGGYEIFS